MSGFAYSLAGYSELIITLLSFYGAGAAVLNEHFGKVFLPVGKPFGIVKMGDVPTPKLAKSPTIQTSTK